MSDSISLEQDGSVLAGTGLNHGLSATTLRNSEGNLDYSGNVEIVLLLLLIRDSTGHVQVHVVLFVMASCR